MSRRTRRGLVGAVSLAAMALGGTTGVAGSAHAAGVGAQRGLAPMVAAVSKDQCAAHSAITGGLTRAQILARAKPWVTANVYYSHDDCHTDGEGRMYRQDCSGFVSMAWGLDRSYRTASFVEDTGDWTSLKGWGSMQPGDAAVKNGHIALFVRWANTAHTSMIMWEESTWNVGTIEQTFSISYLNGDNYHPIRYTRIMDDVASEGSFVRVAGTTPVYQIVGGAAIPVSSWTAVGGAKPIVEISRSKLDGMQDTPRDGTFVKDATGANGTVYQIVGGAPLPVSSWTAVGGPSGSVAIDIANVTKAGQPGFTALRPVPRNGTFVKDATGVNGTVYEIVGGAPLPVSSWASVGGATGSVPIDILHVTQAGTSASRLLKRPADLTFVRDGSGANGTVYEIVGGAPLPVSSWASVGGARGSIPIDVLQLSQAGTAPSVLLKVPANGTFVKDGAGVNGTVYQIVGGAPLAVTSWAAVGGATGSLPVDFANVTKAGTTASPLRSTVADGTFVKDGSGQSAAVYRVVGGAPLAVGSWDIYGGGQPTVGIDVANITKAGQTGFKALSQYPADGTLLITLPGSAKWQVTSGHATSYTGTASIPSTHAVDLKNVTLVGTAPWTHLK